MRPTPCAHSRRRFLRGTLGLAGLGLLCGCSLPRLPWQQPAKVPRIGYLGGGATTIAPRGIFHQGLHELGYVEGQTIMMEYRFTDGRLEQAAVLAAELVGLDVDLIVAAGGEAVTAAKNATATIPIVGTILGVDPVAAGLVASLSRPSGNVTGLSSIAGGTIAKRLQFLQEVSPRIRHVAILWNANNAAKVIEFQEAQRAAPSLGLELLSVEVRRDDDFEGAFQAVTASRADALIVLQEPLMFAHSARVAAFALQARLPSIYEVRVYTDAGGLMSYGLDQVDRYHRAATYVDKILKGTKPADLPVEQPSTFDFVVNLKTARALGLIIPESVLLQATEVLQ